MDYPRVPFQDLQTFEGRAKHLYFIQNKDGEIQPFTFIQAQKVFNDIVEEEFARTKREFGASQCRIIACKPRQVGWTTYSQMRSYDMQSNIDGSNGVIVAHDQETTELIYEMYNRVHEHVPEFIIPTVDDEDMSQREYYTAVFGNQPEFKQLDLSAPEYDQPMVVKVKNKTKAHSGKRMRFSDNDTVTTIFTAGKGDGGGKAGTLRRVHLSEAANYGAYSPLLRSINPSVPKFADDVFFIIESTANGTTGEGEGYFKAWTKAVEEWRKYRKGEIQTYTGFRPVFIPWYMIEEYEFPLVGGKFEDISAIDFGTPELRESFLQREQTMMKEGIYNPLTEQMQIVTPEKINWYRWIIKTDCEYDYRAAQRYYPTTPADAFAASSHCFFDASKLTELQEKFTNHGEHDSELGDLTWDDGTDLVFQPNVLGSLTIYKHPEPEWTNRYVIGADVARGYDDGDYSVAYVMDRLTEEFVACWFGKIDQDKFANVLIEMGLYYNEAYLVPESNLDTVIELIKPDGLLPYIGELYVQDFKSGNQRYGYLNHAGSRQRLLDQHKAWLRERGYDKLPDSKTVEEHLSFIKKLTQHGVKYQADDNAHDDRVIAAALTTHGSEAWDLAPEKYEPKKVENVLKVVRQNRRKKRFSDVGRK